MSRNYFVVLSLFLALLLGGNVSAATDQASAKPGVTKARQSNQADKSSKSRQRRLSLMPNLCAEQFVAAQPHLNLTPPSATADLAASPPAGAAPLSPRLGVRTGWGVEPFVGSVLVSPAGAPERRPTAGDTDVVESAPFCDLDAGVSYNLGPGTNLNLGYRLPNSVLNGVLGPLGEDATGESTGKKVTIGIDIGF